MDMYADHRRCEKCKATFLNGVPHTCDHNSVDAARQRLEHWLNGDFTIETLPTL